MEGKIYQIGKGCGPIWYKKISREIIGMEHHPKLRMNRIFHWLERGRRENGRIPRENMSSAKIMARRKT